MVIEQWGFFSVPYLLWHVVISEDPWHIYCPAFGSGAVTTCFYDLGLSRLGFDHPTFCLRGQRSNPLLHRRGVIILRFYLRLTMKNLMILQTSCKPLSTRCHIILSCLLAYFARLLKKFIKWLRSSIYRSAVKWLKYCRYGVKHNPINQSINQSINQPIIQSINQLFSKFSQISHKNKDLSSYTDQWQLVSYDQLLHQLMKQRKTL